jgi:hypothetical protein
MAKRGHSADLYMLITQASRHVYQNNRLDQEALTSWLGAGSRATSRLRGEQLILGHDNKYCSQQESHGYHSCIVFGSSPLHTSIRRLATLTKIFGGFLRYLPKHVRILSTITARRFPSTFCKFTIH